MRERGGNVAINLIRISGKQLCNYIWCVNSALSTEDESKLKDIGFEPTWTQTTDLLGTFNGTLMTGNITNGESEIGRWKIQRRDTSSSSNPFELAGVVRDSSTTFTDYAVKNDTEYEYSFTAESDSYITSPIQSPKLKTNWDGWCLFSADDTDYENELVFHEGFNFTVDVSPSPLTNNLAIGVHNNFTEYPKIIKGKSNYYSSTLSAVLGYVDCSSNKITDTRDMEEKLKAFTADSRRKFLRDYKGHFWEVEVSASLSLEPYQGSQEWPYSVAISWSEINNAQGVVITNLA